MGYFKIGEIPFININFATCASGSKQFYINISEYISESGGALLYRVQIDCRNPTDYKIVTFSNHKIHYSRHF